MTTNPYTECLCHGVKFQKLRAGIYVCDIGQRNFKVSMDNQFINWMEFYYDGHIIEFNFRKSKTTYFDRFNDNGIDITLDFLLPLPSSYDQLLKMFASLKNNTAFI